jgi:hypothetical protein
MKFAEDYSSIIGGQCVSFARGSNEESEIWKYGVGLVYVNVGLLEKVSKDCSHNPDEHRRRLVELADRVRNQIEIELNAADDAMIQIQRIKALIMSSSHVPISYPHFYDSTGVSARGLE